MAEAKGQGAMALPDFDELKKRTEAGKRQSIAVGLPQIFELPPPLIKDSYDILA